MTRAVRTMLALLGLAGPLTAQTLDSVRSDSTPVTVYRVSTRAYYTRQLPAPPAVHDTVWLRAADTVPACTPAPLVLCPGDSLQAKVTAAGTNAALHAGPGVFAFASVKLLAGQSLAGEDRATVFSGLRVLDGWTSDGAGHWYVGGQTQHSDTLNAFTCYPGRLCGQPEMLWRQGVRQEPVASLAAVATGTWFFDYAADRIYLPSDPGTDTVETSVTHTAFVGNQGRVAHLMVVGYANPAQTACVNAQVLDTVVVTRCHGFGLRTTGTGRMAGDTAIYNGEGGATATGTPWVTAGNDFSHNGTAGFGTGAVEEAAGLKLISTLNAVVEDSRASWNDINGFWDDVNSRGTMFRRLVADSNAGIGILHEVSYWAKINGNHACWNGLHTGTYAVAGGGIVVANSPGAEVWDNDVCGNKAGIMGYETNRTSPALTYGPHDVTGLWVHGNRVAQSGTGFVAGILLSGDPSAQPFSAAANNRWTGNQYLVDPSNRFRWASILTASGWLAVPQDSGSTFQP